MAATIIDGKAIAAQIRTEIRHEATDFYQRTGRSPKLHVFLVGEDPASGIYVRNKSKAAAETGITAITTLLPAATSQAELLARLHEANADIDTDGILVQTPLPRQIDTRAVLDAVDPQKDVDGFHPENAGLLLQGRPRFAPCTPAGIMEMLNRSGIPVSGKRVVVMGRSDIVGKPMAALLLARDATVTNVHKRTRDVAGLCRDAEILIAAVGVAGLVGRDYIRPGAVVVDVGINRVDGKIRGDVDFEVAREIASAITPVPGGVGPLTIAMLLKNTAKAANLRCSA